MNFPSAYSIGTAGTLRRWPQDEINAWDKDPRGILWIWEPPMRGATYAMGIDPSFGRTNWSREGRITEDRKTDNGAVEVVRLGRTVMDKDGEPKDTPDVQVAEFCAPVDAFEIGIIGNLIGRLYAGTEEDQAKCILEVYPGPGTMTLRQMVELGYTNQFRWERYADASPTQTNAMGWHASPATNRDLWTKSSRHIIQQKATIRSPWLAEEYANCRYNPDKQWGENPGGHDDRVRAFNLALWLANSWTLGLERTQEKVTAQAKAVDFQASDMTMEEINAGWSDAWDRMTG